MTNEKRQKDSKSFQSWNFSYPSDHQPIRSCRDPQFHPLAPRYAGATGDVAGCSEKAPSSGPSSQIRCQSGARPSEVKVSPQDHCGCYRYDLP